jgi:hypothetical protein
MDVLQPQGVGVVVEATYVFRVWCVDSTPHSYSPHTTHHVQTHVHVHARSTEAGIEHYHQLYGRRVSVLLAHHTYRTRTPTLTHNNNNNQGRRQDATRVPAAHPLQKALLLASSR